MNEYPYPLFDEKGKVVCQICGKSFLVISPKHLQKHNLIYADYTKRYPKAPLSTKEFVARGKYGKNKDLFIHPENEEIGDEVLVDDNPDVEELNVEKLLKEEKPLNPMEATKARIIDLLRIQFSNIKKDYLINQIGMDGRSKFEFITDFCDPILKVVIQFPDTFWHNEDAYIDINKSLKLMKYGWKIIEVPTQNPSLKEIDKKIKELY